MNLFPADMPGHGAPTDPLFSSFNHFHPKVHLPSVRRLPSRKIFLENVGGICYRFGILIQIAIWQPYEDFLC
jgi:hypothetical protein